MFRERKPDVSVSIARKALESIFDECDRYDAHETGGRLIGTYQKKGSRYDINVSGVIGPGPSARRTATSFFQDGHYQEEVFRSIEEKHPELEHLGNWHTHHVNGYPTLSRGDEDTYFKTVNHPQHNTDFFYAVLVVRKNASGNPRYEVNHYLLLRGHDTVYEVPKSQVRVVDVPVLWPADTERNPPSSTNDDSQSIERVKDQEFFSNFYPNLKPLFSKSLGALYWKGPVPLVDGSQADLVVMEHPGDRLTSYSITAGHAGSICDDVSIKYRDREFPSARHAVINLERDLNREIFLRKR